MLKYIKYCSLAVCAFSTFSLVAQNQTFKSRSEFMVQQINKEFKQKRAEKDFFSVYKVLFDEIGDPDFSKCKTPKQEQAYSLFKFFKKRFNNVKNKGTVNFSRDSRLKKCEFKYSRDDNKINMTMDIDSGNVSKVEFVVRNKAFKELFRAVANVSDKSLKVPANGFGVYIADGKTNTPFSQLEVQDDEFKSPILGDYGSLLPESSVTKQGSNTNINWTLKIKENNFPDGMCYVFLKIDSSTPDEKKDKWNIASVYSFKQHAVITPHGPEFPVKIQFFAEDGEKPLNVSAINIVTLKEEKNMGQLKPSYEVIKTVKKSFDASSLKELNLPEGCYQIELLTANGKKIKGASEIFKVSFSKDELMIPVYAK